MLDLYSIKLRLHKLKKIFLPIRGKSNIVKNKSKNYRLKFDVIGDGNQIFIGNCMIHDSKIVVRGNNHCIIIEDDCYIKNLNLLVEDNNCKIFIGKNTTIEGAEFDVKENFSVLKIEENCMFSKEIYISTSDSHSILNLAAERINLGKSIHISKNVWLGRGAKVLKGVTIYPESIIASGSIVTRDVLAHSIYAGNPARLVKKDIYWLRERL